MTYKPPQGIDATWRERLVEEIGALWDESYECPSKDFNRREWLRQVISAAPPDTQGIDAPNCAHKQLKKQMVGEQLWYACECGQKFLVELWDGKVSVLAPPDPRKDLAALEEMADRWRSTGNLAANMPKHEYVSTVATGETLIACADELEQRLAEMRGAKR